MGLLTKNTKPVANYHQWAASELTNGDILGVYESLGGRAAHSVTIESIGGASTLRFNVSKQIYREWRTSDQWAGMGQLPRNAPTLIEEIEEVTDNVVVASGNTQIWLPTELSIRDIKIISKSSGLKITIT